MHDLAEITTCLPTQNILDVADVTEPITAPIFEGPPDVIQGLLPRAGELVIAGATDVGKSLVALEICSALTSDRPLWGELEPTRKANKILYVLGEHYNNVIKRLWRVTGLPMSDKVLLLGPERLGYDKWLVMQGRPNLKAIDKFKHWVEGTDLIVFDPLASFITGIDSENDNIQMRLVLDTMSLIAQSTGASCLVLAHQGKPMIDKSGKEYNRKSYAIRGTSAIEDAATNIFYMSKAEGESDAAQKVTDGRILALTRRKYKGLAPAEYRLLRDSQTLCHTLLGNRPFAEVIKMDRLGKLAKLQYALPNLSPHDAIIAVAAIQGCSETTIRRDLGLVK